MTLSPASYQTRLFALCAALSWPAILALTALACGAMGCSGPPGPTQDGGAYPTYPHGRTVGVPCEVDGQCAGGLACQDIRGGLSRVCTQGCDPEPGGDVCQEGLCLSTIRPDGRLAHVCWAECDPEAIQPCLYGDEEVLDSGQCVCMTTQHG